MHSAVLLCLHHSPWEIVDPYPVLVNHNAGGHHPDKNLCVALVLKAAGRERRDQRRAAGVNTHTGNESL